MRKVDSIEEYLEVNSHFAEALDVLRQIINSTELVETLKWNAPVYTLNGKNVLGLGAFKNHFSIWFFNGVFLKDERKVLVSADEKTKALRQMRFESLQDINKPVVLAYVNEAIENQYLGKELQISRNEKAVIMPSILNEAFKTAPLFKESFQQLTSGKQREYVEYIESAKRDATKASRLDKIKPMILKGIGLHDKYRNL
ncbi:YdeI/OmpD-associated family protein [Gelidibacter pelagius]|uniref:YdeI/OmpD-associated family protein n=1 Tax=Gelidibacter pelagius TaxID=2819985 RepID=A0ABS3SW53_9FLAO|nr:DUF1801 domain-containing protein [Gelidibacter pelagius]MBO3099926.1 YdeI/OmpD-associated family protein [Gelidibacter pelagius]